MLGFRVYGHTAGYEWLRSDLSHLSVTLSVVPPLCPCGIAYRIWDRSMQHTCSRHAARDPHTVGFYEWFTAGLFMKPLCCPLCGSALRVWELGFRV